MIKYASIFLVLLIITVNQAVGQLDVRRVDNSSIETASDGFFYSLPRTGFKIDIVVKKTQKIKGPYSEFADKYLGLSQVINVNSTEFEIASIRLTSYTEPDPSEYYFVKATGKRKNRVPIEFFLSENGTLVGMPGIISQSEGKNQNKFISRTGISLPEVPNPTMVEHIDTVIRRISVDTTTIEQKIFKKISSTKTPDQKAKEAADFILKLDESMFNLINGYQEVNYEKGTMEYMYSQMDDLKNEYLQLFKGVTGVASEAYSYSYIPLKNSEQAPVTLCKFSISKGILDKTSATGDLVQIEINKLDAVSSIRGVIEQRNNLAKENKGIYYRIPDEAKVAVKIGGQVKFESQFPVNQLGVLTFLPASVISNLELYNNTGGLKHVILK